MLAERLIYTKLPPGQSPQGKTGFHSVLVGPGLDRSAVLALESLIHYPGARVLSSKRFVSTLLQAGKPQLVMGFVETLSSERDEFGREGVFLAQLFVLPSEALAEVESLPDVAGALAPYLIHTIDAIREMAGVDWAKGHIAPVSVDLPSAPSKPIHVQPQLASVILAQLEGQRPESIVVAGPVEEVTSAFEAVWPFVPLALRSRFAFDPAFDGGKSFFFPIKLQGYSQQPPTTGEPLVFDLSTAVFRTDARLSQLIDSLSPYGKLINASLSFSGHREAAYRLSVSLSDPNQPPPSAQDVSAVGQLIVQVAGKQVRNSSATRFAAHLPEPWPSWLAGVADPLELLQTLSSATFQQSLAQLLRRAILGSKSASPNERIPKGIIEFDAQLGFIEALRTKTLSSPTLPADAADQRSLISWAAAQPGFTDAGFMQLLSAADPAVQSELLNQPAAIAKATEWFSSQLRSQKRPVSDVSDVVARGAVKSRMFTIPTQDQDWLVLLKVSLVNGQVESGEMRSIVEALKLSTTAEQDTFFAPLLKPPPRASEMPNEWLQRQDLRDRYLDALIAAHGCSSAQLLAMGWPSGEVDAALARKSPGFFGRLRRTLGI